MIAWSLPANRIEAQIERFAPGFQALILARHAMRPADLERYHANYVGGDINGGRQDLTQLFTRPVARLIPYSTAVRLYLSARLRLHRAEACMACAATGRTEPRFGR